jgi:hypothetical protein
MSHNTPGIYPGLTFAEYAAIPAMSSGVLSEGLKSMAHLKYAMETPHEDTPALLFGRALHTLVLEGDTVYNNTYATSPAVDRRTKAGKEEYAAFLADSAGKTPISQTDCIALHEMASSVLSHHHARDLLSFQSSNELTIVWIHAQTQTLCKSRIDSLIDGPPPPVALDIKTTRDASQHSFARAIYTYNYHLQSAFYLAALAAHEIYPTWNFLAIEKTPPYPVAIYELDSDSQALGKTECDRLLAELSAARHDHIWPGYPPSPFPLSLPEYAFTNAAQTNTPA